MSASLDTNHNGHSVSVEIRGLVKSFDGRQVLKGINLTIQPGEIFVIMGPSGSGKSVLLKQIIGLETPESGEVLVQNEVVQGDSILQKYRLAMVFQSGALLNSLNVEQNTGLYLTEHHVYPPAHIKRIVAEKLALVGLQGEEQKMPGELSGGMKKRVAIARALVIDPQLILYDEPTSELDPLIAVTIGKEIVSLRKRIGATSIVVTHDRDLAFGIADRIALMHQGEILCTGTPEEVEKNPNSLIQQFLHANFQSE